MTNLLNIWIPAVGVVGSTMLRQQFPAMSYISMGMELTDGSAPTLVAGNSTSLTHDNASVRLRSRASNHKPTSLFVTKRGIIAILIHRPCANCLSVVMCVWQYYQPVKLPHSSAKLDVTRLLSIARWRRRW